MAAGLALSGTALAAGGGWISDKPEGLALKADGTLTVVTDNDGVDGWSGETAYLRIGRYQELFPSDRQESAP